PVSSAAIVCAPTPTRPPTALATGRSQSVGGQSTVVTSRFWTSCMTAIARATASSCEAGFIFQFPAITGRRGPLLVVILLRAGSSPGAHEQHAVRRFARARRSAGADDSRRIGSRLARRPVCPGPPLAAACARLPPSAGLPEAAEALRRPRVRRSRAAVDPRLVPCAPGSPPPHSAGG